MYLQCLSVIFFVNFLVEVLFYLKILQKLFTTLGWLLQKAIGTTAVESINCCVSVFFGLVSNIFCRYGTSSINTYMYNIYLRLPLFFIGFLFTV